ncbi:sensor histidine kinase [soil metagenome]
MTAQRTSGEHHTRMLLRGLHASGFCVMYHDADLGVLLVENVPPGWPSADAILAGGDAAVFDPETNERVLAAKRAVLAAGTPARLCVAMRRPEREALWFDFHIEQDRDASGKVLGLFVSISDITRLKQEEQAVRSLLFEVSHRTRNMLAILQSVLGQTARHSSSVSEFEEKFRGRIDSLARSQDLITAANWRGVRFRRLAEGQVAPFAREHRAALQIGGSDPVLSPNTALHLGLALHELAANSRAYGVLEDGAGTVRLTATPLPGGCRVDWIETFAEPIAAAAMWGFGRTVLSDIVPRAVQGEVGYRVAGDAVTYFLDLPVQELDPPSRRGNVPRSGRAGTTPPRAG